MGPNYNYPSPSSSRPTKRFSLKLIFIIVVLVAALIIGLLLTFNRGDSVGTQLSVAVGRQAGLIALIEDSQPKISNPLLARLNADAGLFMTTDNKQLVAVMNKAGVGGDGQAYLVTDGEVAGKLETASTEGRFDAAYKSVLDQKLDAQQALLRQLSTKIKGKETSLALSTTYSHLELIRQELNQIR